MSSGVSGLGDPTSQFIASISCSVSASIVFITCTSCFLARSYLVVLQKSAANEYNMSYGAKPGSINLASACHIVAAQ